MNVGAPHTPLKVQKRALPTDIYVDNVLGSDANPGSQAAPFATLDRAIEEVSIYGTTRAYDHLINVWMADSPQKYSMPDHSIVLPGGLRDHQPQIRIRGDHNFDPGVNNELATATLTDTSSSSGANGWVLTAAGAGWTPDEYRGKLVKIVGGARNGKLAHCYRNTEDTLYCSPPYKANGNGYLDAPAAGDDVSIREYSGVEIDVPGDMNLGGLNVWGVRLTGAGHLRIENKVQLLYCDVQIGSVNIASGGFADIRGCYLACAGNTFPMGIGMLTAHAGAYLYLSDGVVVDGVRAADTSWARCHFMMAAVLQVGDTTFRQIHDNGIRIIGSQVGVWGSFNGTFKGSWGFDDCRKGPFFNVDQNGNGGVQGGANGLGLYNRGPGANGLTNSVYVVVADAGAYVRLDANSTLTGTDGDAKVSADGGATNVTEAGHTVIEGYGTGA